MRAKQKPYIESQITDRKNGLVVVNQVRDAVKSVVAVEPFLRSHNKGFPKYGGGGVPRGGVRSDSRLIAAMRTAPAGKVKVIDIDSYVVYNY